MAKNPSEFDLKIGPPPKFTRIKEYLKVFALFTIPGVLIGIFILLNKEALSNLRKIVGEKVFFIALHTLLGLGICILIGFLQALILRKNLQSRYWLFILIAGIGGIIGGSSVGILVQNSVIHSGYMAGFILGFISSSVSSLVQEQIMSKGRQTYKWFLFNITVWSIIFSAGWEIAWFRQVEGIAVGAIFILITMGVSFLIFLNRNPEIEFG